MKLGIRHCLPHYGAFATALAVARPGTEFDMMTCSRFEILSANELTPAADSDCDCACAQPLPALAAAAVPASTLAERHPQQQALALHGGYSVAFVPSASRIAVLNDSSLGLLRQFSRPRPIGTGDADAQNAARQLLGLGLLRPYGSADQPPLPADELVAWLHVTNACNLRCTYCYLDKTDEAMAAETAFAAVDAVLRAAQRHGYARVLLKYAGGEASLNLALVAEMHQYAQAHAELAGVALRGVLLSNGVGLTRRRLEIVRDLGLRLMISLDGPESTHNAQRPTVRGQGSYRATVGSIERAQAMGIDTTVSITVTGASVASLPDVLAWLLDRQIYFSLNFYRENNCSSAFSALKLEEQALIEGMRAAYHVVEHNLPRYSLLGSLIDRANLGAAHSRTCAVGENYMVIDQAGNIAKCQMEIAQPVTTIWADNPLEVIRLEPTGVQNLPVEQKQGCRDCEWRYWCAGGCPIATFRATGRYDIRSPNCAIYQALYPEVLRLEGLRLLHYRAQR